MGDRTTGFKANGLTTGEAIVMTREQQRINGETVHALRVRVENDDEYFDTIISKDDARELGHYLLETFAS